MTKCLGCQYTGSPATLQLAFWTAAVVVDTSALCNDSMHITLAPHNAAAVPSV